MKKRILALCLILVLLVSCASCGAKTAEPKAVYTDDSETLQQLEAADNVFAQGDYLEALNRYLGVMEHAPKSLGARLGVAKCQIELENYNLAAENLSVALQIDPSDVDIYEIYVELSQRTGAIGYSQQAIALAKANHVDSFLERIPEAPHFVTEPGTFGDHISMELAAEDADAVIYFSLNNSSNNAVSQYNAEYSEPVSLMHGESTITAYVVRDGMPSESVEGVFNVNYPEEVIEFAEPLMEELARQYLPNNAGAITNYMLETITYMYWNELTNIYDNYSAYEHFAKAKTLEDLKYFPCLRTLSLQNQYAELDYSPLADCPELTSLVLSECNLTNTDFVQYVPNLYSLNISDNRIRDISGLMQMKNLTALNTSYNENLTGLDAVIRNNPNLCSVYIADSQLDDFRCLMELEHLNDLDVYGVEFADYGVISQLTNLEYLQIIFNGDRSEYYNRKFIKDLGFLKDLTNLGYLYLNGVNDPEVLAAMPDLPKLSTLYLYNCKAAEDADVLAALQARFPNCTIYH